MSYPDGSWQILGIISPSQLTADQNDWNPTDFAVGCGVVRVDVNADGRKITGFEVSGIATPIAGTTRILLNVSASYYVTIAHQSGSSSAANRVICPGAADFNIPAGGAALIWYDSTSARWRAIAVPASASSGAPTRGVTGTIDLWPFVTLPANALECDGSTPLRASYPALHALMAADSYPWGNGDGSTTFGLPNGQGRFPQGADGTDSVGATGGSKTPTYVDAGHTHVLNRANAMGAGAGLVVNVAATNSGAASISTTDGRPKFFVGKWIIWT